MVIWRRSWNPGLSGIARHVRAGAALHADDTPVPVLDPGRGRTKTGRLWTAVRDESPYGSTPAAFYLYSPDRRAERANALLKGCRGHLHADAYAGFARLYEADPLNRRARPLTEVACCWRMRAAQDLRHQCRNEMARGGACARNDRAAFAIEADIKGRPPAERPSPRARAKAAPILSELRAFLDATMEKISGKSSLAGAFRYAASR